MRQPPVTVPTAQPIPTQALAIIWTVIIAWGLNVVMVRIGTTEVSPLTFTAARFALVALLLMPFIKRPAGHWKAIIALALIWGVGHFGLLFVGLSLVEAGPTAIILLLGTPFSSILAMIFFGDRLGWKKSIGMALAFAGVALMSFDASLSALQLPLLILVLSSFMWAAANIIIKQIKQLDILSINGWSALIATPILTLLAFQFEDPVAAVAMFNLESVFCLLYTVLASSIFCYYYWFQSLQRFDVNSIVPYTLAQPVVTFIAGYLILGESFTALKLIGSLITTAGIAVIFWRGFKRA